MVLAITTEQEHLADAVGQFAARHAPIDKTRASFDSIASGEIPHWWPELVAHGFHAVHLAEAVGGQGGTLADLGCVIEAAAAALLPGPLLATATTSAVADLAGASGASLVADIAAGATAVVVLPDHSDIRATAEGEGWRLVGSSASILGICAAQRVLVAAETDDGHRWFMLDARGDRAQSLVVDQREGTDLSTDVGVLRLVDHVV